MRANKGITIVTLVITVIIIGLLTATATYSGINILSDAKKKAFTTELKAIQEKVNIYSDSSANESDITNKSYIINKVGTNVLNYPTSYYNGDKLIFNSTGTADTGNYIIYTAPSAMTVQVEVRGAAGGPGNVLDSGKNNGGKGAYIKTNNVSLNSGDRILIVVGQMGKLNHLYKSSDGTGGGRWSEEHLCLK